MHIFFLYIIHSFEKRNGVWSDTKDMKLAQLILSQMQKVFNALTYRICSLRKTKSF